MDNNAIELCKAVMPIGLNWCDVTQRIGVLMHNPDVEAEYDKETLTIKRLSSIEWLANTSCCAGLRAGGYGSISKDSTGVEAIISVSQKERGGALGKEEAVLFYDILINHTPYGRCIVSKDPEYAYEQGLIIDAVCPSNIIAGCLMAQRLAWEYVSIARSIIHYAGLGVNKSLSFLLGHTFSMEGALTRNSGHCCVESAWISKSYIRNFMLRKAQPDELYSVQVTYNYNVHNTWQDTVAVRSEWGNYASACEGDHIAVTLAEYAKSICKAVVVPNPFAKSLILEGEKQTSESIVDYFTENLADILAEGAEVAPVAEPIFDEEDEYEEDEEF